MFNEQIVLKENKSIWKIYSVPPLTRTKGFLSAAQDFANEPGTYFLTSGDGAMPNYPREPINQQNLLALPNASPEKFIFPKGYGIPQVGTWDMNDPRYALTLDGKTLNLLHTLDLLINNVLADFICHGKITALKKRAETRLRQLLNIDRSFHTRITHEEIPKITPEEMNLVFDAVIDLLKVPCEVPEWLLEKYPEAHQIIDAYMVFDSKAYLTLYPIIYRALVYDAHEELPEFNEAELRRWFYGATSWGIYAHWLSYSGKRVNLLCSPLDMDNVVACLLARGGAYESV